MKHKIDIASFRCECGHRSTPPAEVNSICHEMDFYKVVEVLPSKLTPTDDQKIKSDVEKEFKGNTVRIVQEANRKVAKFNRSYCRVKQQSNADSLAESDHIVLGCPNCGRTLFEVKY